MTSAQNVEQYVEQVKPNLDLLETVDELEQQVRSLKSRIAVYIPVKNDIVDQKLAEYFNNPPNNRR